MISLQKNLNYIYRERATHAHIQREIKTLTHPRETKQKTNHFIYIWKTCKRYNLHDFVLQSLIDRHTHTTERAQAQTHVNTHTHTHKHTLALCVSISLRVNERGQKESKTKHRKIHLIYVDQISSV